VDEPVRHAISKLATFHLVATQGSRERLIAMGEAPERIYVTGAPGLDGMAQLGAMPREECLAALGMDPRANFVLALFHPVVQQADRAGEQTRALLLALGRVGLPVVWLEPNADAGSADVLAAVVESVLPAGSRRLTHVERPLFAAALRHCAVLAGNSSAGIIEAASFGTPVVNIGDRQRLRERNANVVDVRPEPEAIEDAVREALRRGHVACENVWGDGQAAGRIADVLARLPLGPQVLEKANTY
jgi:GDP/UDP-N,N'-diacetylbacillosamine 2-epimerase (hydrolysing)